MYILFLNNIYFYFVVNYILSHAIYRIYSIKRRDVY